MRKLFALVPLALISSLNVAVLAESALSVNEGCGVAPVGGTVEFSKWCSAANQMPLKYWQPYEFSKDRDCMVSFLVARTGEVVDVRVDSSSWSVDGDVSALEACWSCGPFTKPPAEYDLTKAAATPPNYDSESNIERGTKFARAAAKETFAGAKDFWKANPELTKKKVLLHAVPISVIDRYPGQFTKEELSSVKNVLAVDKDFYNYPTLVRAYYEHWQKFFINHPKSTRTEILMFARNLASEYDPKYKSLFSNKAR